MNIFLAKSPAAGLCLAIIRTVQQSGDKGGRCSNFCIMKLDIRNRMNALRGGLACRDGILPVGFKEE